MNIELYPLERIVINGVPICFGMDQSAVEAVIGKGQLVRRRHYYFGNEMAVDYSEGGTVEFIEII